MYEVFLEMVCVSVVTLTVTVETEVGARCPRAEGSGSVNCWVLGIDLRCVCQDRELGACDRDCVPQLCQRGAQT